MSVPIMRVYTILYGGTSRTDLDDKVIASSKIDAIKKFIIDNKGKVLVYDAQCN